MRNILSLGIVNPLACLGGDSILLPIAFTTDGSNDPTLVEDFNDSVSISRNTNAYTITFKGNWHKTLSITPAWDTAATINCTRASTPASGTVTLSFSGAITSGRVDVNIVVKPRAL